MIMWVKLFYFFRIFFSTAYLAWMIEQCFIDMRYFVLFYVTAMLAFTNAYYILDWNSKTDDESYLSGIGRNNFFYAFIYTYRVSLGDFNIDTFQTHNDNVLLYLYWLANTVVTLIVMLNLVVAIIGDSFDKVQ